MEITITIDDDEILEEAKKVIIEDIASRMLSQFRGSTERYCYRTVIKECVREVIKSDIDNLSDRAVTAASKSIENRAVKKLIAQLEDK